MGRSRDFTQISRSVTKVGIIHSFSVRVIARDTQGELLLLNQNTHAHKEVSLTQKAQQSMQSDTHAHKRGSEELKKRQM